MPSRRGMRDDGGGVPRPDKRRQMLQKRVAEIISTIRADCGDISLRELCRRSDLPLSTMSRAQRGDADVSFLETLIALAGIWPRGDLWTLLSEILPDEEARQVSVGGARAALSADTQQALERAMVATAKLDARVHDGDLQAVIRLTEALLPALDAVVLAANAVAVESLALRDGESDLAAVLGGANGEASTMFRVPDVEEPRSIPPRKSGES